ncbi:MAG: PfkB family carbohydrate kinase [Nocardioidaceae bacterium]
MNWRPRRLILVGSVIADVSLSVAELPERGGDILAGSAVVQAGGGFVVLFAGRSLGLPAVLAGRIGQGPFGDKVALALNRLDVDISLPRAEQDTGFCIGLIEPDGERTFVTSPGAEAALTVDELRGIRPRRDDAIYVSGYELAYPDSGPAIATWITEIPDSVLLALDPGPLVDNVSENLLATVLARTNVLTLNAREARLMGGATNPGGLLLERLATDALVVFRDGARGCTLFGRSLADMHVPAPKVDVVDTTGAGDTHTGALLAELSRIGDIPIAARNANAAAALSVTRTGSATCPARECLDQFLDKMGKLEAL